ncbi:hypothetical protein [Corynebacterium doosanense]|uniref:hypothetical protein n=1 Tax=Corynebacterium doosanense TaxID=1121358 RepID=UPI000378C87C|nr:hypothetical protein [Corynebacterium doosanense]
MNDFDEFARQFRRRTAARMLEFEATMDKIQRDVEKSAAEQAAERRPRARAGTPRPAPRSGQVKSVLRRD